MTYNIDFAIRYDGVDEFSIMSAPRGSGVLLKTPVVENIDRQSLRNLRSLIDGALNTSAEELDCSKNEQLGTLANPDTFGKPTFGVKSAEGMGDA